MVQFGAPAPVFEPSHIARHIRQRLLDASGTVAQWQSVAECRRRHSLRRLRSLMGEER